MLERPEGRGHVFPSFQVSHGVAITAGGRLCRIHFDHRARLYQRNVRLPPPCGIKPPRLTFHGR